MTQAQITMGPPALLEAEKEAVERAKSQVISHYLLNHASSIAKCEAKKMGFIQVKNGFVEEIVGVYIQCLSDIFVLTVDELMQLPAKTFGPDSPLPPVRMNGPLELPEMRDVDDDTGKLLEYVTKGTVPTKKRKSEQPKVNKGAEMMAKVMDKYLPAAPVDPETAAVKPRKRRANPKKKARTPKKPTTLDLGVTPCDPDNVTPSQMDIFQQAISESNLYLNGPPNFL